MIRTIIIDDEINGRKIVRGIVETQPERFIVAGEGFDIKSGLQVIKLQKPDLVLLDINLPDGTAFDLLEQIGHVDFKIIFITPSSGLSIFQRSFYPSPCARGGNT